MPIIGTNALQKTVIPAIAVVVYGLFYGFHDVLFCLVTPGHKFPVGRIILHEIEQLIHIEGFRYDTCAYLHGVISVAFLFYMYGYHQYWFLQVYGFAYRLKSCRSGVASAASHQLQKLFVVDVMEGEPRFIFVGLGHIGFVPEKCISMSG